MSVLICTCGFSCGTRSALTKHFKRFESTVEADDHQPSEQTQRIFELSEQYGYFDTNGDHQLDFDELSALLRKGNSKITTREIRMLFDAADTDGDNLVNFDEFLLHIFTPGTSSSSKGGAATRPSKHPVTHDGASTASPQKSAGIPSAKSPSKKASASPAGRLPIGIGNTPETPQHSRKLGGQSPFSASITPAGGSGSPYSFGIHCSDDLADACSSSSPGSYSKARSRHLDAAVRFLIVRHGRSANKQRAKGQAASLDPELSEQGYEQAEALGARLADDLKRFHEGDLIVASSPMRRCLLTIRPAVFRLNIAPGDCICHGACYEFGCAGLGNRGTPATAIAAEFPEFAPVCFDADGMWEYLGSNQRESQDEARWRAARIVDWIWEVARTLSQRSHGTRRPKAFVLSLHQTMADLICQVLVDGTAEDWVYGEMKYKLQNTGITEILLEDNGRERFAVQNDSSHLRDIGGSKSFGLSQSLGASLGATAGTAKIIAQLRSKFSTIDKTGDHKLDLGEMTELLRSGDPNLSDNEIWQIFNGADHSNDGDIDFDEFLDYIFTHHQEAERLGCTIRLNS